MNDLDDVSYFRFTARQERDKALSELKGILQGFVSDREFHPQEIRELRAWQVDHQRLMGPVDFNDIDASINRAVADGRLEQWEVEEIRDLCDRASTRAPYFELITKSLQELHGFLHGILTDRTIKVEELRALTVWMEEKHDLLSGLYPYNEIESLILSVLRDQKIDEKEQRMLQAFFSQFVSFSSEQKYYAEQLVRDLNELCVGGVCAVNPDIKIEKSTFCFTGTSNRGLKSDFADAVERQGGTYLDNVDHELDYLVIGAAGNRAWAYSCFGRKVEKAIELRKRGLKLLIIHEVDFWDAL